MLLHFSETNLQELKSFAIAGGQLFWVPKMFSSPFSVSVICWKYGFYSDSKGRLQNKKSKKSDIVTKGRVGWNPNPYF